jgi:hypothetical protein
MKHVVERCPSCGVEHEKPGDGACEACGETLRSWCRLHGREAGWLSGPACHRCAEEAARPAPAPAPPVARPAPAPPMLHPLAERPPFPHPIPADRPARRRVLAPAEPDAPPPSVLASMQGRLLAVALLAFIGWQAGVVAGAIYGFNQGGGVEPTAGEWGWAGGAIGLLAGLLGAAVYTLRSSLATRK